MKVKYLIIALTCWLWVSCGTQEEEQDATGRFEATTVTVSAQVAGEIMALSITEGDTVGPGRLLGYIDTLQLSLRREELLAQLSSTDSRRLNERRQLAALRQQIENVRAEQQRFAELVAEGAVPEKQLDDINYQLNVLERQLVAKEEDIDRANSSLTGQSAAILAQVAQVEAQLQNCKILSPIQATVLEKYMEAGEYAVPGRPLFKVADLSELLLRAYLTAPQMMAVKIGQTVEVRVDGPGDEQKSYAGKIIWIADEAEFTPKTIQTRDERANLVYAVKILVKNDGFIKRGMYGEVKF